MALLFRHLLGATHCSHNAATYHTLAEGQFPGALIRYHTLPSAGVSVSLSTSNGLIEHDSSGKSTEGTRVQDSQLADTATHHSPPPPHPWHKHLQLDLLQQPFLWRAALIEFFGTMVNTYWSVTAVISVASNPTQYFYPPLQIGLLHVAIISICILATARSSGGHLNSMLTIATWIAGLTEFSRMILYIPAQITGSIVAAYIIKSVTPFTTASVVGYGGCYLGSLSTLSGFVYELFFSLVILTVAFGIALDESQRQVFGPIFGPIVIGLVQGSIIYISPSLAGGPGYTGASCNPSRCIGPSIAWSAAVDGTVTTYRSDAPVIGNNAQWIYWVAPIVASMMIGVVYRTVPPAHMELWPAKKNRAHSLV